MVFARARGEQQDSCCCLCCWGPRNGKRCTLMGTHWIFTSERSFSLGAKGWIDHLKHVRQLQGQGDTGASGECSRQYPDLIGRRSSSFIVDGPVQ